MSNELLIGRIRDLEFENLQLRKVHADQRGHLSALREEIQLLRGDLLKAQEERRALGADNARLEGLLAHASRKTMFSTVAAVALTSVGAWFLIPEGQRERTGLRAR